MEDWAVAESCSESHWLSSHPPIRGEQVGNDSESIAKQKFRYKRKLVKESVSYLFGYDQTLHSYLTSSSSFRVNHEIVSTRAYRRKNAARIRIYLPEVQPEQMVGGDPEFVNDQ